MDGLVFILFKVILLFNIILNFGLLQENKGILLYVVIVVGPPLANSDYLIIRGVYFIYPFIVNQMLFVPAPALSQLTLVFIRGHD